MILVVTQDFDYCFAENGLTAYRLGEQMASQVGTVDRLCRRRMDTHAVYGRASLNGSVMKNTTSLSTLFCVTLLIWISQRSGKCHLIC